MPSACAQSGILEAGLIACRHNAARVSMMPLPSEEMYAESMCYYRPAYAPRTRARETDGLSRPWAGRVWLNPPYAAGVVDRFVEKLVGHVEAGDVRAAVLLVHARTDAGWFHRAAGASDCVCLTRGRVSFLRPDGDDPGAPTTGSAFFYFGPEPQTFKEVFSAFGWMAAGA